MLMRFDPFREVEQALRSWNGPRPITMPMDAFRRGDEFHVLIDLPGIDADSIDMTVERNVLEVTARRDAEVEDGAQVLVMERPTGEVTRRLFLGEGLDTDRIEASHENGVLTIRLPVAESAKPHRIAVNGGYERAKAVSANSEQSDLEVEDRSEDRAEDKAEDKAEADV
jgi:HSP20 family protein